VTRRGGADLHHHDERAARFVPGGALRYTVVEAMKHRHLRDGTGLEPAAIDDILDRGGPSDWAALWRAIDADPFGSLAADVLRICAEHRMYGTSRLWPAMIEQAREDARAG